MEKGNGNKCSTAQNRGRKRSETDHKKREKAVSKGRT